MFSEISFLLITKVKNTGFEPMFFVFCLFVFFEKEKERSETKKRMKEEEMEKGVCRCWFKSGCAALSFKSLEPITDFAGRKASTFKYRFTNQDQDLQ